MSGKNVPPASVADVFTALNRMTGGRLLADTSDGVGHPFAIVKSSAIQGKGITELPGLIVGDRARSVRRLAVTMTMTESSIELAAAAHVDCIVAHHPVADGASSGGVALSPYLGLYNIALFELHEAFHGLHPGIPQLHGHNPSFVDTAFGGKAGNVIYVGRPLPGISIVGDVLARLGRYLVGDQDLALLEAERRLLSCEDLVDSVTLPRPLLRFGSADAPVSAILHFFPHAGFDAADLERALSTYPEVDLLVASISRLGDEHALLAAIEGTGLPLVFGACHPVEILENGLPLAYALRDLLPEVEILILRERTTLSPLDAFSNTPMGTYGRSIAADYLVARAETGAPSPSPAAGAWLP